MKLEFVKISPTQNMTILVTDTHPRKEYQQIAERLLDYGHLFAEQVGFIEEPENRQAVARLQMMGGEFCGNATMSLAAYLVWKKQLPMGSVEEILLEVSGAEELLNCRVEVREEGLVGKVKMPSATHIEEQVLSLNGKEITAYQVILPGIIHYIVPKEQVDLTDEQALQVLLRSLGEGEETDALGLIFWERKDNSIVPLVYVIPTDTMIWERGCGSGSAAVGAFLAQGILEETSYTVPQPGGEIVVTASPEGDLWIQGKVQIVAEGTAYLQ